MKYKEFEHWHRSPVKETKVRYLEELEKLRNPEISTSVEVRDLPDFSTVFIVATPDSVGLTLYLTTTPDYPEDLPVLQAERKNSKEVMIRSNEIADWNNQKWLADIVFDVVKKIQRQRIFTLALLVGGVVVCLVLVIAMALLLATTQIDYMSGDITAAAKNQAELQAKEQEVGATITAGYAQAVVQGQNYTPGPELLARLTVIAGGQVNLQATQTAIFFSQQETKIAADLSKLRTAGQVEKANQTATAQANLHATQTALAQANATATAQAVQATNAALTVLAQPTATPSPAPTATPVPQPTPTPVPAPTATPVPQPTVQKTANAIPTPQIISDPPRVTQLPPPTNTAVPPQPTEVLPPPTVYVPEPTRTIAPPPQTTVPPPVTTAIPPQTTVPPPVTTAIPPQTTAQTTVPPVQTTNAPPRLPTATPPAPPTATPRPPTNTPVPPTNTRPPVSTPTPPPATRPPAPTTSAAIRGVALVKTERVLSVLNFWEVGGKVWAV